MFGTRQDIDPSRVPAGESAAADQLYTVHPRPRYAINNAQIETQIRTLFSDLDAVLLLRFLGKQRTPEERKRGRVPGRVLGGMTLTDDMTGGVAIEVNYETITSLIEAKTTDSQRAALQWEVAETISHELMHVSLQNVLQVLENLIYTLGSIFPCPTQKDFQ